MKGTQVLKTIPYQVSKDIPVNLLEFLCMDDTSSKFCGN